MDKDKLLQYFQTHYLSKREVLFRLPLNISIDGFWPELLNRRKARATILPLYNAFGKPYWFTLTDRMISASEKLCEAAMSQEDNFDPYRVQMTGAMLQECFFTSFVEGAQIPVQEAMDFLQRGNEPENIQEQMLWNNRNAWTSVMNALYRPIDENMLKSLSFMLTEDMEGCSEEYRQTDQHTIAAMNNESYSLPSAYALPERMNEYCAFLQAPDVHPLIKSAVGQAYILTVRPFPEGNERMSRMISYIVLMRSGYDFFRDITVSGMIARESYRYYKSMCEVLRDENDGDLTYFVEYFIDMLARALEAKKEMDNRHEQEILEAERSMVKQALQMQVPSQDNMEKVALDDAQTVEVEEVMEEVTESISPENAASPPNSVDFWTVITGFEKSKSERDLNIARVVRKMVEAGKCVFTCKEWQAFDNRSKTAAQNATNFMLENGLIEQINTGSRQRMFRFIATVENIPKVAENYPCIMQPTPELLQLLASLEKNGSQACDARIGRNIKQLLNKGISEFTASEWVAAFPETKFIYQGDFRRAIGLGILSKHVLRAPNSFRYEINMKPQDEIPFYSLTEAQRVCMTLLYKRYAHRPFTTEEAEKCMQKTNSATKYHLMHLTRLGLLECQKEKDYFTTYHVAVTPEKHPECFTNTEKSPVKTEKVTPTRVPVRMSVGV